MTSSKAVIRILVIPYIQILDGGSINPIYRGAMHVSEVDHAVQPLKLRGNEVGQD